MPECALVQLLLCFPFDTKPPDMYNCGNTRINYILGLEHVASCMIGGFATPYGEGCPRNHRMICVDFNQEELFGNPSCIPPAPFQHFHTKQPKLKMKYKEELNQLFKDQGIWTRIDWLDDLPVNKMHAQQVIDTLGDEITRCMLRAAQMCARERDLWRTWIPELWIQGLVCLYWRLLGSRLTMGRDYTDQLLSMKITLLENKIVVPGSCECLREVDQGKQQAKKRLNELRNQADQRKDTHLEVWAKEWEKVRGGNQAAFIRCNRVYENEFKINKKLRGAFGESTYQCLDYLLAKKKDAWVRIVDRATINQTLLKWNWNYFSQAKVTPFGQRDRQQLMGWSGTSPVCQNFLSGNIPP